MADKTVQEVFNYLRNDICADEINVVFSQSGSAYFRAWYKPDNCSSNELKVRVSDHAHPGQYDGICLHRGDKLPEIDEQPLLSQRFK